MTEQDGSVETGSPEGASSGADRSGAAADNFLSGLDEGSRGWIEKNGISLDDPAAVLSGVVTKSREMESLIGKSLRLPGDDATPEDLNSFYDKATERLRPAEANGYEFAPPENMPEDLPYNSEFADAFRQAAHEVKLPKAAAKQLHDWFVDQSLKAHETASGEGKQAYEKIVLDAAKAMQAKWGNPESEIYKQGLQNFHRALAGLSRDLGIEANALKTELLELGAIDGNDQVVAPNIILALSKVGDGLYSEDTLVDGDALFANNPFAEESKDWGKQGSIIRSDRDLALRLIKAAGKDPKTYGM